MKNTISRCIKLPKSRTTHNKHLMLTTLVVLFSLFSTFSFSQWNPNTNWLDSYQANGLCWCESTFDHNIGNKTVEINGVDYKIEDICDELKLHPAYRAINGTDPIYNDIQCGNGPPNDHNILDEQGCPGRVDLGTENSNREAFLVLLLSHVSYQKMLVVHF